LAESDSNNVVNQLQEVYLDYQALNPHLFSLDIPSVLPLQLKSQSLWSPSERANFQRMVDGVLALLLSLRAKMPSIRFDASSSLCKTLAEAVEKKIGTESQFIEKMARDGETGQTTILFLDRK